MVYDKFKSYIFYLQCCYYKIIVSRLMQFFTFYMMLGRRVPRSWVCSHITRQMNGISQRNYNDITNSALRCMESYKLLNNNSNQAFSYLNSIVYGQKLNLRDTYFKDFKAFYSNKPTDVVDKKSSGKESDSIKPKNPKKEIKTYITLLGADNSISISTVESAKKIADRRNLKLVKVMDFDPKSSRAVYKLVTELQYLKEDWSDSKTGKENAIKVEKLVSFSSKTEENDVLTKLKMIKKWLTKNVEVKVVISGDIVSGERVYKVIERELGSDGRIVQKRVKSSSLSIRFQIIPPKKTEEKVAKITNNE